MLSAPARRRGAQVPKERPTLARLAGGPARRACVAGESPPAAALVRPRSRTRTQPCRENAPRDRSRLRAEAPPAARRGGPAATRKNLSADYGGLGWWRRRCRTGIHG